MAIVQNKGPDGVFLEERWGFCDACGRQYRQGATVPGYVQLTRELARSGWQVLPFLELYCPAHKLAGQ